MSPYDYNKLIEQIDYNKRLNKLINWGAEKMAHAGECYVMDVDYPPSKRRSTIPHSLSVGCTK